MFLPCRILLAIASLAFLTAAHWGWSQSEDEILIGKVLAIGDGDTFYLRTQDGRELWIALWGVECPDVGQKIGQKARRYAERYILGREIGFQMVVPREETERSYGRVVYRGSQDLALDLLRMGFAVWVKSVAPDAFDYAEAEQAAQSERLGVWKELRPPDEEEPEAEPAITEPSDSSGP
ncbi:MAG: thermonuclease family protein [Opitutaceae bacterium]